MRIHIKFNIAKMKKIKLFVYICIVLSFQNILFAKEIDDKTNINNQSTNSSIQLQLNSALSRLEQQLANSSIEIGKHYDNMSDVVESNSSIVEDDRSTASKLMTYLDANPDKVKSITDFSFEDLTTLPVGLKFKAGQNNQIYLGILQAVFKENYAELTVFARIKFTIDGVERDLFFGIDQLKFTRKGFVNGGGFRAVLLGNYVIPGKKWTLVLKGGSGIGDRTFDNTKTYVDFDCNDFQEASLAADIIFPRSVLLPYDATLRQAKPDGRVVFKLEQAKFTKTSGTRGIIAGISVVGQDGGPFCVPGFEKFGFKINNAWYDQHDTDNPKVNNVPMVFPENYQGDKGLTWSGIFIENFEVFLPKAFTKQANEAESGQITCLKSIGGKGILIDRTGFTGLVYYDNSCKVDSNYSAQKWNFTVSKVELEFLQNDFIKGTFGGGVSIPIHEPSANQSSALINYLGTIEKGDKYTLILDLGTDLPITIKALRSKGKLLAGSWVKFEYLNDKFYPSCDLSGEFSVGTKVTGSQTDIENTEIDPDNQTASFKGLKFYNLAFQTRQTPYVSVKDFSFAADTKIAGFPVDVKLKKRTDPLFGASPDPNNDLWIDFGLMVGVAENKFSGSSTMVIKTRYEDGRLKFKGLSLTSLYISGSTTAFDLAGGIEIYEDTDVKGFRGAIKAKLKTPFVAEFEANANFGYQKVENYRYGYVDVYAALDAPGMAIPTGIGDLAINGAGLGIYFNMRPSFKSTTTTTSGCNFSNNSQILTYCPDKQIPFGFKVALGLKTLSESFRGRLNLDFALDRQYGINSISLYGSGVFGGKFDPAVGGSEKDQFKSSLGNSVTGKSADELANIGAGNDGQNELVAKATVLNSQKSWDFTKEGDIAVAIGMMINVPQKTLHAEAEVFINKDKLVGIGLNGRVGRAVLHWGKDDLLGTSNTLFYIHAGYPSPETSRMGIKYNISATSVIGINAYLMIGYGVLTFPLPPTRVMNYLKDCGVNTSSYIKSPAEYGRIKTGTAFALGAGIVFKFEPIKVIGKWNIRGGAEGGFDVLLSNNDSCKPDGGWLARGQVYGWAEAGLYKNDSRKIGTDFGLWIRGNGLKPLGVAGDICIYPPIIGWITGRIRIGTGNLGDVCN